ncbi:MAG: hypothetical protein ACRBB0_14850 [Pelagimonas sp.]|uniref:hypothetical protein n=1 Tax=Pelagimonas sp. TaxID=2073170 RepID=UPI003D6BDC3D
MIPMVASAAPVRIVRVGFVRSRSYQARIVMCVGKGGGTITRFRSAVHHQHNLADARSEDHAASGFCTGIEVHV